METIKDFFVLPVFILAALILLIAHLLAGWEMAPSPLYKANEPLIGLVDYEKEQYFFFFHSCWRLPNASC